MAVEQITGAIGFKVAAADLSAKQFYSVKVDSTGKIALTGAGELGLGILQNDPTAGLAANVAISGASKAVVGAAVAAGARLSSDANGKLITATAAKSVVAQALEAGAANGDIISVHILNAPYISAT